MYCLKCPKACSTEVKDKNKDGSCQIYVSITLKEAKEDQVSYSDFCPRGVNSFQDFRKILFRIFAIQFDPYKPYGSMDRYGAVCDN